VAGAYLPARPSALHLSQLLAMDGLRLLVIVAILLVAAFTAIREYFVQIAVVLGLIVLVIGIYYGLTYLRARRRA